MRILVQKYGGSSVADLDRIRNVARRVRGSLGRADRLVVVVSAMGKTTDSLIAMASALTPLPDRREMDQLLATGEQVSVALLSIALQAEGVRALSLTGPQAGIRAAGFHTEGRICDLDPSRVLEAFDRGFEVVVVAGFQGDKGGDLITLGRGGSDLTAVALAASLEVPCEIYTDVPGIFTADPRVVPRARRIEAVDYEECMEMALLGAKVMQARSVELAYKYGVPIYVASTFLEEGGSWIMARSVSEGVVVKAVVHDRNIAKVAVLGVPDRPGVAAFLFESLSGAGVAAEMIIQSTMRGGINDIAFVVKLKDLGEAIEVCKRVVKELKAQGVVFDSEVGRVSVVGAGLSSDPTIPARTFRTLAREGINIDMIASGGLSISCVVRASELERAVRALHAEFIEGVNGVA